jgi:ADP-ribose pyrophosphatase YjhB (NUDIX family)
MPEATVAAILLSPDGQRIVLVRRATEPFSGLWCLPGGHIEKNESSDAAVRREVEEETGLSFTPRMWRTFDELLPERNIHAVVSVFQGVCNGPTKPREADVGDAQWFRLEDAAQKQLAFHHNQILAALQAERLAPLAAGEREESLTEYKALRDEALERMRLRNVAQLSVLTVAATLVAAGMKGYLSPLALMVYPVIACFLALLWSKNDVRIGEIGEYIRDVIEARRSGLGWEGHLRRINLLAYCRRGGADRSTERAAYGLFAVSQALVSVAAGFMFNAEAPPPPERWSALCGGAVYVGACMGIAWLLVRRRRRGYQDPHDKAGPVRRCTEPDLLAEIAADETIKPELRLAAVENPHLVNPELLGRLAQHQKEKPAIRQAAIKRLDDRALGQPRGPG